MDTFIISPSHDVPIFSNLFLTIHRLAGRDSIAYTYEANCLSVYFHNGYCAHPASYKILVCVGCCVTFTGWQVRI
jgi:hypothetical protein